MSDAPVSFGSRLLLGGISGCGATLCVHPLDVVRVQLQLDAAGGGARMYSGGADAMAKILRNSGLRRGIYAGIDAGLLRQLTYGMSRFGLYTTALSKAEAHYGATGSAVPFGVKLALGSVAGGLGGVVGCPAEVVLTQMAADSRAPPEARRNYASVLDALRRIVAADGPTALWTGCVPTVARAMLLNGGQFGVYSQAKESAVAVGLTDPLAIQVAASLGASFVATSLCCPADVVKSRMQNDPAAFPTVSACVSGALKAEGPRGLWKGFGPAFMKLTPHTVISFLLLERLTPLVTGAKAM